MSKKTKRTNFGLQDFEKNLNNVLKPIFSGSKQEFVMINNLVKNWEDVIGKKYAKFCYPKSVVIAKKKNAKSKLTIGVFNPGVGFFLEQNSEVILERIASYYGFKSIEKIIIKQEPQEIEIIKKADDITLNTKKQQIVDDKIKDIADKELAQTLARLGKMVLVDQ